MNSYSNAIEPLEEAYISVDIEAAGPVPGDYSMLSLGACVVDSLDNTFYVELKPLGNRFVPEALAVTGLSLQELELTGRDPAEAMTEFQAWMLQAAGHRRPVFVGFNAGFDWQFVNWYFFAFLGANPFGPSPLDIKAYYMGLSGCTWKETSFSRVAPPFQPARRQTHNALDDAVAQAEMFGKLLAASRQW